MIYQPERRQRVLTEEDAEAIGQHLTDKLIERLADEDTAEQIMAVWSRHIDQRIGKGVRRLIFYIAIALLGVAAMKFDAFGKLFR